VESANPAQNFDTTVSYHDLAGPCGPLDPLGGLNYRPLAVLRRTWFPRAVLQFIALSVLVLAATVTTTTARAQDGEEGGGGYAWGEGGGESSVRPALPEDPLRIMAYAGAGVGFRLVRNLDFMQEFLTPAYLDFGAAVYLPGQEFHHGVGLAVSTGLVDDVGEVDAGAQWAFTPAYQILLPFQRLLGMDYDMFQLQGRFGVPIVVSGTNSGGVNVSVGLELGVAFQFKFLAGLGIYVEVQADIYGGSNDTVHPIIALDGGLLFDYEVLP
jgi:hypothetical protein